MSETNDELCRWEGCTVRQPLFAPKVCTPAKGLGIKRIKPLSCICNMPLCDQHFRMLKVEDLLTEDARKGFANAAATIGKLEPDFERAWLAPVSVKSPEFRNRKGKA